MADELFLHLVGVIDQFVELLDIAAGRSQRVPGLFVDRCNVVDDRKQVIALALEQGQRFWQQRVVLAAALVVPRADRIDRVARIGFGVGRVDEPGSGGAA